MLAVERLALTSQRYHLASESRKTWGNRTRHEPSTALRRILRWACAMSSTLAVAGCAENSDSDALMTATADAGDAGVVGDAGGVGNDTDASAVTPCGDGTVAESEGCDDGNTTNGDGCSSRCVVESGWECAGQPSACHVRGDCASKPCQNGGACTDTESGHTCECLAGYVGANCETNVDDCAADPCENGGTCTDGVNSYSCECVPGFTGTTCETDVDECAANPCKNGGSCTDGVNSYSCQCAPTYEGAQCTSCVAGRADCNGSSGDGCEALLQSDASNCNACGFACPNGELCSHGACQAPPTGQAPGTPISVAAAHTPLAPAVADIDRDGKLDILVANAESGSTTTPSGSVSVFKGLGNGTISAESNYPGATLSSNAVAVADVNGDGWPDAITVDGQTNLATTNGTISVYLNLGAAAPGTFGAATSFTTGAVGSVHLCTADFNGDGKIDVATTSVVANRVSVLFGSGAGSFGTPSLVTIDATGGVQSTIGCRDLNGDAHPDLVVTSPSAAHVSVLLNKGDGSFAAPVPYPNAQNGLTAGIAFGDANGDGKLDILSNGAAGVYLFFFKGNGDGTFATGVPSATGASAIANSALGVVASDFNGDGKLDAYLLRSATGGGVVPMTGIGDGTFTAGTLVATGISPGLNAIAVADMDGNGYGDLVLTNKGSGTVTVIPNSL